MCRAFHPFVSGPNFPTFLRAKILAGKRTNLRALGAPSPTRQVHSGSSRVIANSRIGWILRRTWINLDFPGGIDQKVESEGPCPGHNLGTLPEPVEGVTGLPPM
jgi:hypothetical protein